MKYTSILGEREIVLSELDPSTRRNFVSRHWISLCEVSDPPLAALIREFYSNLSVYSEVVGSHYLTSWIRVQEFTISKKIVSKALGVPLVRKPSFLYTKFPSIDDIKSLLYSRPVSWGTELRINSCEFTKLNSLYLRISYHNIYLISQVHIVPINRCVFLYALVTDASMCFASLFIQTIVDISRSKSKGQKLFFPMYIYRIFKFLGLFDFPPLKLIHITAHIGATFLRQR